MPRLGHEKPVHPRIAEIFMTPEELQKRAEKESKRKQDVENK
jgi:hypothetical protein